MTQKRRKKGEGTLYARAGGYLLQIDLGKDATGKRIRKSFSGPSVADVKAQREAWERDRDDGLDADAVRRVTLAQTLTAWLAHLDATIREARPRTYHSYRGVVMRHLVPRIGETKLRALTPADVEAMVAAGVRAGLSVRTASYNRAVLRIAINWAMRQGWVTRNVAALARVPAPAPVTRAVALTVADAKRVIAHPHRLRVLWLVALTTGLRQGELLGLQWRDIDLDAGVLHVRRQLQRIDGALVLRDVTKTRASAAPILLPPVTVAALRRHRETGSHTGFVFRSTRGTPLEPRNVTRAWHALLATLAIADVRFHDVRHTCGSLLYDAGVPDKVIQSVLRHARVSTTQDTYLHPSGEIQETARAAMERIFGTPE